MSDYSVGYFIGLAVTQTLHHRYITALTQKHKSGFALCNEHGWFKLSHERKQAATAPVDTSSKHQEYDALSNSYWNTELLLYISPVWSMSSQSEPEPYKETRIQIKCHNVKLQWPYRFLNRKKFKDQQLKSWMIITFEVTSINPEPFCLESKILRVIRPDFPSLRLIIEVAEQYCHPVVDE